MTRFTKPVREAGLHELLEDEIGRLVMRADRIDRCEVEAMVSRVKAGRTDYHPGSAQLRKETVS